MTVEPDTENTIFTRIRDAIAAASRITNFSRNSPERAFGEAFAASLRERQHEVLSTQLSTRLEFAGAEITEVDLQDLGLDPEKIDLELLNSFQEQQDLDEVAARNSVERDPGNAATGTVTFETSTDSVVVPAGTRVTTEPDAEGDVIAFETDSDVSPAANSTTVDADVTATERGLETNVAAGALTQLPAPPSGVISAINNSATTGGIDEESDEDLRERARLAIVGEAGGGTTEGVENGIVERFDGVELSDVVIDEQPAASPPTFDVVVDGGPSDAEIEDAIEDLRPVAIQGTLVRPTEVTIDVTATVSGTDIDTDRTETAIRELIETLGIGGDVIRDQLIAEIMTSDDQITGISSLSTTADGTPFSDDQSIGPKQKSVAGSITVNVA
jgi:uncharacterized phage protein gp47/JayE